MSYTGDPKGGAKNVINCRCVTLYIDPDDEVIQDEDTVVPQKPIKEPLPERNITAPIEPAVTALTFKMVTRLEAQKSLTAEFAEAAKDDRYLNKRIDIIEAGLQVILGRQNLVMISRMLQ